MALSRKFLTALGIEGDKVDEIINAHADTVDALKEERDKYKADAEKLPGVEKELDELKAASAENDGKNPFEVKYNAIKEEFEKYKAEIAEKQTRASKEDAYRELLKDAGVADKRISSVIKVSSAEIDKIELDADGKVRNAGDLKKAIEKEWEDFIVKESKKGADTGKPPENTGGATMSKEEILAIKDTSARQQAMLDNKQLFI